MSNLLKNAEAWIDLQCSPTDTQEIKKAVLGHLHDLFLQDCLVKLEYAYQNIKKNRFGSFSFDFIGVNKTDKLLTLSGICYSKKITMKRNNGKINDKREDIAFIESALRNVIPQHIEMLSLFEDIKANDRFDVYKKICQHKHWNENFLNLINSKVDLTVNNSMKSSDIMIAGCQMPAYVSSFSTLTDFLYENKICEFIMGYACKSVIDFYVIMTEMFMENEDLLSINAIMTPIDLNKSLMTNYISEHKSIEFIFEGISEKERMIHLNEKFKIFNESLFAYFFEKRIIRIFDSGKYKDEQSLINNKRGLFFNVNEIGWKKGMHMDYGREEIIKTCLEEKLPIIIQNIYEKKSLSKKIETSGKNTVNHRI